MYRLLFKVLVMGRENLKKTLLLTVIIVCVLLLDRTYRMLEPLPPSCPTLQSQPGSPLRNKHTNIVFLKTHKTSGTTIQNILFRFADHHNLTVALPKQNYVNLFGYPRSFSNQFVHPHTLPANIICNVLRFNKTELQRLMPRDAIYVTIMREPGAMFESSFSFFNLLCESFSQVPDGSIKTFLEEPQRYYKPDEPNSMFAHNLMTFDLGGDHNHPATDVAYAHAFVAEMEQIYSLVMISEYFDESLILLRHLLSWDLDDILYLELNMRTASSKQSLTLGLNEKIRAWNSLDAHLYDHFNTSLWRKLNALDPLCLEKELELFRRAREKLMMTCFGVQKPRLLSPEEIKNADLRPWQPNKKTVIKGYDLPKELPESTRKYCLKFTMPEIQYTNRLLHLESLRHQQRNSNTLP
ncbi:galactose-3-O-sulfotransferase 3-like [Cynoglossus semilaevis]|uniref:Galactose-3-O-sulfotransferase 3 n=1 Tax=Cynoglossus semilaevis TaxID=244447 RepID=A0A3P8VDF4_CYNSE|nr:galactose-3-O-sulfotransferase 3-like [Cynoglossus semilaevis]